MRFTAPAFILATTFIAGCVQDIPTEVRPDPSGNSALSAAACENVRGEGIMDLFNPATPPVTLYGDLAGISYPGLPPHFIPHGQGAYHGLFAGDLFITEQYGTFSAGPKVIFAPMDPPLERWNGQFEITGGEQISSGFLRMHGTLNTATGEGEFRYHGRICG